MLSHESINNTPSQCASLSAGAPPYVVPAKPNPCGWLGPCAIYISWPVHIEKLNCQTTINMLRTPNSPFNVFNDGFKNWRSDRTTCSCSRALSFLPFCNFRLHAFLFYQPLKLKLSETKCENVIGGTGESAILRSSSLQPHTQTLLTIYPVKRKKCDNKSTTKTSNLTPIYKRLKSPH